MGGFAAGFAGGLQGAGQEIQQRNLFNLVQDIQQKEHLAKAFEDLAQNPNVRPEVQQQMLERSFQIRSLKPGQNHKKFADISDLASAHYAPLVPPPPGQAEAAQIPQGPQGASAMSGAGILAPQAIKAGAADVAAQPSTGPGQGIFITPQERAELALHVQALQAQQQQEQKLRSEAAGREQRRQMIESDPELRKLTDRQKAIIVSGQNITPELRPQNIPGIIHGSEITDPNDAFGNPIDKSQLYRMRQNPDSTREYFPTMVPSLQQPRNIPGAIPGATITAPADAFGHPIDRSATSTYRAQRDPISGQLSYYPTVTAALLPTMSSNTSVKLVPNNEGSYDVLPVTSTQTRQRGIPAPVNPAPPGTAAPSPSTAPPKPRSAGAGVPVAKVGQQPGQRQREQQMQELSPQGQKQMEEIQPVKGQFQDLIQKLEPFKDNNTPGYFLGRRALYKMGVAPDENDITGQIANLSLASIQGMMPFASKSRNYQYIRDIAAHLPNVWVDSPKNVYQKLVTASKNFDRMENSINRFETKHATVSKPAETAPPAGTAQDEAERFLKAKGLAK